MQVTEQFGRGFLSRVRLTSVMIAVVLLTSAAMSPTSAGHGANPLPSQGVALALSEPSAGTDTFADSDHLVDSYESEALTSVPRTWDWEVWPTYWVDPDGNTTKAGSGKTALAQVVQLTRPGDVVQVNGHHPKLWVAVGDPNHSYTAIRPEPFDFTLLAGEDPTARPVIEHLGFGDKGGGIDSMHCTGTDNVLLTFDARWDQAGVLGFMDTQGGAIKFSKCYWQTNAKTKWGVRIHGSYGPLVFEDCGMPDGGIEHGIYVDNPQGLYVRNCHIAGWGRTGVQTVLRWWSGEKPHGRPTSGDCEIIGNKLLSNGWEGGGSGSSITIAGWIGGVARVQDNYIASPWGTGAVVGYSDVKQRQLQKPSKPFVPVGPGYLNENGYAIDHLIWKHNTVVLDLSHPNANNGRDVSSFGGVEKLDVIVSATNASWVTSPKWGLQIEEQGDPCGEVRLLSRRAPSDTWHWEVAGLIRAGKKAIVPESVWSSSF